MAATPLIAPVETDQETAEAPVLRTPPRAPTQRHRPPVDAHPSRTSRKDTLADAGLAVAALPVFVTAAVAGAIGQLVAGVVTLASEKRRARAYRAQPGC